MKLRSYHIIIFIVFILTIAFGLLCLKYPIIHFLAELPWYAIFILTSATVLGCIKLGLMMAAERAKTKTENEGALNAVVGAIMGLLAFILAFTFGATTTKLETKRELLLDEVTAIETLYNTTHFLPDSLKTKAQKLTREYAQIRLDLVEHPENFVMYLKQSEVIQATLLQYAIHLANQKLSNSDVVSLYTEAVNHVIAIQTKRITIASTQLPTILWVNLYAITFFSMVSIGYLFGGRENANWTILLILALSFSAVIILIADLDRNATSKSRIIVLDNKPMKLMLNKISR